MGQSTPADVPDIPPSIHPRPYLPLYSAHFTAFRTSRPLYCFLDFASTDFVSGLLLSGLRVRFTAFWTSRPRTSRPVYCFLDFASALLLSGLRVHGLRVRFTAFRTSRPLYCFLDFASGLLLSGLRVHGLRVRFTAFRTSRSHLLLSGLHVHFTCFPRASALHLPLHILQIPTMLLSHDKRGELPQRTTIEAAAGTKRVPLMVFGHIL
ncbi:hypothetical protein CDL15_Pgr027197 [Punica granatum]|uniref:Uncharacterized protein n=1 Tax=Punica granatum TaxID=22663 RepID=A0A218W574_PUNGR|nr:hypothetical protein CDL15_Pgr027197 [Punica granatum]